MRKQLARTLLAAGTVAAVLSLTVPAAMAAGTWTVTGGPNFTSAASSGSTFTLNDTTKSLSFSCTVGTGTGSVTDQSMSTNTAIGSITASTFGSSTHKCSGAFGSTGTSSQKSGTTMTLNAGSYNSTTGVTTGTVTNVDHILSVSSILGNCTAEVKGTAGVTYTNSSDLLAFTTAGDSMKITATTCSFLGVNDVVTFSSNSGHGETVTGSPTNPIQVKQP